MESSAASLIESEVQGACSSLGSWTSKGYTKDPDCVESLKDILRYLRRDSGSHDVRRLLGRIQVLSTDLLPLLKFYYDSSLVFELLLRLLVNLTNPAILLYKEELPQEKSARNDYLEILTHLQSYKKAFTDSKVWEAIVKKLESLLYMSPQERGDEEKDSIERTLVMVRNVVHVPANPTEEKRTDDDVSVHDQVLWAMHLAKMEDLLLYICTSDVDQDYCFHALEILSLMLREQSPEMLATAGQGRSSIEKVEDELQLIKTREMELSQKKKQMQARMGRHPRFGGTFTVQNMQAIGENKLISHSPLNKLCEIDFDQAKAFRAKAKNRRPTEDGKITRRSTLNIRLFLKSLCQDFLKLAYNPMMKTVKRHLQRNKAQSNDESYYFWAIQFFMEFCRLSHSDVALVSETLSKETFHYIQTQMEQYYEMMVTEKRKIRVWAKRLHVALKAYRELVKSLASMDNSQDERVKEASRALKGTIFYMPEYREVVLYLLLNFNDYVQPISYLRDLAETVHVYLKMLEQFTKQNRHVIVQEKKKARKKAKPKKPQPSAIEGEEDEQLLWLEVATDLSKIIQEKEELPNDVVVFDPTLGNTEEDHMLDATHRIQRALKSKKQAEALALLRSARQLWPETQVFGSDDISPDDEFMMLRQVFFAKLGPIEGGETSSRRNEAEEEEEDSEGEGQVTAEKEFSFLGFMKRFANPKVIIAYSKLLSHFRENSPTVNHCTARMFHRLAWDLKLEPMMFQASLFGVFQDIMGDYCRLSKVSPDTGLKDLNRLATYVVRCFVEHASKNNLAMMELLFWKNSKDAYELQYGYGSSAAKSASKVAWTEEEECELRALYERFKEMETPDKDVVDYIMENNIDQKKTRRAVIVHLKNLGLVEKTKVFKKKVSVQRQWTEDEVTELQELFDKYQASTDIMGMIMERMSVKRPRHRVVDKLLELGLVRDKKQLRKRQPRKADNAAVYYLGGGSVSEIDTTDSEGDDGERVHGAEEGMPLARSSSSRETFRTTPRLEVATTSEELKNILTKLVTAGNAQWLEWLMQSLEDAVEDWDDGDEPTSVPLVPFLEHHHSALQDSDFCSLLKTMGIDPPASEQEAYWRIPASMTTTMINSRIEVLKKAQEGDYSASMVVVAPPADDWRECDPQTAATVEVTKKKKVKHLEALRETLGKKQQRGTTPVNGGRKDRRRRQRKPETDDEDEVQASGVEAGVSSFGAEDSASEFPQRPSGSKRKRPILSGDSDDEGTPAAQTSPNDSDGDVPLSCASAVSSTLKQNERKAGDTGSRKSAKKRLIVLDDSDDDETVAGTSSEVRRNDSKEPIWIDSDTTASLGLAAAAAERTMKATDAAKRSFESDEELEVDHISKGPSEVEEDVVAVKLKRHRATVISSDEEE